MYCETIQVLVISRHKTVDQPTTTAGKQWITALRYLDTCPGWCGTFWGRHFEAPDHITLFTGWGHSSNVQTFLTTYYQSFLALLAPFLDATPIPLYAVDIGFSLAQPAAWPGGGGVTTISKRTYNSLSAEQRSAMSAPTTFTIYEQDLRMADEEAAAGFKGGAIAWVVDPTTGMETSTMIMLVSWDSLEAEQLCENTILASDGSTLKEASLGEILRKADPGSEVYHVEWDFFNRSSSEFEVVEGLQDAV